MGSRTYGACVVWALGPGSCILPLPLGLHVVGQHGEACCSLSNEVTGCLLPQQSRGGRMPNRRDRFRLGVVETPRWPRPLAHSAAPWTAPPPFLRSFLLPETCRTPFQRRRPMHWAPTLLPQRASLLSSPRPPPLPSVPRDRGEAPYKAQSRRGAQPSCHPELAGLRRPKRGTRVLGTGRKRAPGRKVELPRVLGGMSAPCRLRLLGPAVLKTRT